MRWVDPSVVIPFVDPLYKKFNLHSKQRTYWPSTLQINYGAYNVHREFDTNSFNNMRMYLRKQICYIYHYL
jgi:hypothetical protein